MKRIIYLICFTFLGGLLGFLLHALIELYYIRMLVVDFDKYGFGLTWSDWYLIHSILTGLLILIGSGLGFYWGKKWWRILYVEGRYRKWLKKDLKQTF